MERLRHQRFILISTLALSLILHLCYGLEDEKQMSELQYKIDHQEAIIQDKEEQIEIMDMLLDQKVVPELKPKETYIGEFTITYYCACRECCDKADGITASGTLAQEGQTVAADWDMLEPGTEIFIEGVGFRTVEDKGGVIQGNRLDVYMESHTAALEAGIGQAKVYVLEERKEKRNKSRKLNLNMRDGKSVREVFDEHFNWWYMQGKTDAEIAGKLYISSKAVSSYRKDSFLKPNIK